MDSTRQRLADALARAGANAVLLSRPDDVCYATGFVARARIDTVAWGPPLALVTASGEALLLCPDGFRDEASLVETRLVPSFDHARPVDAAHEYAAALDSALRDAGVDGRARLAVDRTSLPAAVAGLLRPGRLLDARPIAREARLVKSERELELLRAAARAADSAQDALPELAQPGRNELEVAAALVADAARVAGEPPPWPDGPRDRELEAGDAFRLDLSVRVRGYWARTCNVALVGRGPTEEQLRAWHAAREAYDAASFELWPGRRASDAYTAAAAALARHGLRPVASAGSQVGASPDEEPRLVAYDHTPLEPGMVFAVRGGELATRIVLVTETGPQALSRFRWAIA